MADTSGRSSLWTVALRVIKANPVLGVGGSEQLLKDRDRIDANHLQRWFRDERLLHAMVQLIAAKKGNKVRAVVLDCALTELPPTELLRLATRIGYAFVGLRPPGA